MDVDADLLDVADGDDEESRGERGREGGERMGGRVCGQGPIRNKRASGWDL